MNFISSITLQFKDAFSSGFTSAQQSMAGMQNSLGNLGNNGNMMSLAADLSIVSQRFEELNAKVAAMIEEPSRLAGAFDSSLRNIQSLTGETNASLAETSRQILEIGGKSVAGPNAAADAFYNIASGVGRAEVRMNMLTAAINLSEAGQADLQAATSGLISVVNAYNTPAENMGDLSDVFFQTVKKGVGSLDGFVSAMSSISGLSASVGIGFDELGSSMAFLTAKGQTESVAATQLKAAMVSLMRPNKELSEALASIGISSGSAMLEQFGLAESLTMVKAALGGNQDRMAKALGSVEALQAAIALTADDYTAFAQSYSGGLSGATAQALEAQAQSYESRVARLQAASDSLKIQMGDDINAIKGFFVDMQTGFLTNVVGPIMSSPVGGAFQRIAAVVAIGTQNLLSFGSTALNTASQLVTVAASLQNSESFLRRFGSATGTMLSPLKNIGPSLGGVFKTIGTAVAGAIPAIAAFGATLWAALAPILPIVLAVVAGVAVLAVGGYMLVKHWDAVSAFFVNLWNKITGAFSAAFNWIKNLLSNVSGWVLGAVAVFLPFIGIPALIIKYWDTIKAFFVGLWVRITALAVSAWEGIKTFFTGLWSGIVAKFVEIWNGIPAFFNSLWNSVVSIVTSVANWFIGIWNIVTGAFAAAWTWVSNFFVSIWNSIIGVVTTVANWFGEVFGGVATTFAAAWMWVSDLFTSIWENIKGVVMGFVEWLQPVIDMIIAPFKAIGNAIGGIIGAVKGWFGETVEIGQAELDRMAASRAVAASAGPAAGGATPAAESRAVAASAAAPLAESPVIAAPSLTATTTGAIAAPSLTTTTTGAVTAPALATSAQAGTGTGSSGNSLLAEHLAAASRKGIAGTVSTTASDAFMNAGASAAAPGIDLASHENEARVNFAEAAGTAPRESVAAPWSRNEARAERRDRPSFTVQNLYLQSEDIEKAFDLYRQLEMLFANPQEAAV